MKNIIPHLYIENCKEAIEYYQTVFGGEIKNTQLSDGIESFKGHEGKYIHAELHINEQCKLYFADIFSPVQKGNNIWVSLGLETEAEISKVYQSLLDGGQARMELQDMFWGAKYGVVVDKYGVSWELNLPKE